MNVAEFSVFWWDREENYHAELRFVEIEKAINAARRLTHGPASVLGVVKKVMITDGGDLCCFLWTKENGVEFPTRKDIDSVIN